MSANDVETPKDFYGALLTGDELNPHFPPYGVAELRIGEEMVMELLNGRKKSRALLQTLMQLPSSYKITIRSLTLDLNSETSGFMWNLVLVNTCKPTNVPVIRMH